MSSLSCEEYLSDPFPLEYPPFIAEIYTSVFGHYSTLLFGVSFAESRDEVSMIFRGDYFLSCKVLS